MTDVLGFDASRQNGQSAVDLAASLILRVVLYLGVG